MGGTLVTVSELRPSMDDLEGLHAAVAADGSSGRYLALCRAYFDLADMANASDVGQKGVLAHPGNLELRAMAAQALTHLHDWQAAKTHWIELVKAGANDPTTLSMFGETLLRLGDRRAADVLAHAKKAGAPVDALYECAVTGATPPPPREIPLAQQPRPTARVPQSRPQPTNVARLPPPAVTIAHEQAPQPPLMNRPSQTDVRPRIVGLARKPNAAADSLRRSAAAGDHHLSDLLGLGLLELPGVRVPAVPLQHAPPAPWRRRHLRFLGGVVTLAFMVLGGGVALTWYEKHQNERELRALETAIENTFVHATPDEFDKLRTLVQQAKDKGRASSIVQAYDARAEALWSLLYGDPVRVVSNDPIAKAAVAIEECVDPSAATLALQGAVDDPWKEWLLARAAWCQGNFAEARASMGTLAPRFTLATIDGAAFAAQEGGLDTAVDGYRAALLQSANHPLALLGRAEVRALGGLDAQSALDDLAVHIDDRWGARTAQRKFVAIAWARYQIEDFAGVQTSLEKLAGAKVSGQLAERLGLLQLLMGKRPSDAPNAQLGDAPAAIHYAAAGAIANGHPGRALGLLQEHRDLRSRLLAGQAYIDTADFQRAVQAGEAALALSPQNWEAQLLIAWARASLVKGDVTALEKLSRRQKNKLARHALGEVQWGRGDTEEGLRRLEQALDSISQEAPHPAIERTYVALAIAAEQAGKLDDAKKQLDAALAANPQFAPAKALLLRRQLERDPKRAAQELESMRDGALTWPIIEAVYLEALANVGNLPSSRREEIAGLLRRQLGRRMPPGWLVDVATRLDPTLVAEVGLAPAVVPLVADASKQKRKPKSSSKKRRR